jgi:GT2 family glycosyltransferase
MIKPEVSVVVLTKSRREQLKKCLLVLFGQSYKDFEVVVVDHQSTDGTKEMVVEIQKQYGNLIFVENKGIGFANGRNCGVMASRGEIIAFTDDDCIPDQEWLRKGVETLVTKDCNFVKGVVFYPDGTVMAKMDLEEMNYPTANMFYKKSVLEAIGMFDERFVYGGEDLDVAMTALEKGYKLAICPEAIVHHPIHIIRGNPLSELRDLLKRERFRLENGVLLYKKHKSYRKRLVWGLFVKKTHIVSATFSGGLFVSLLNVMYFNSKLIYICMMLLVVLSYLWVRVLADKKVAKYPGRIILAPYFFLYDIIELLYVLRGDLKHRYFVL